MQGNHHAGRRGRRIPAAGEAKPEPAAGEAKPEEPAAAAPGAGDRRLHPRAGAALSGWFECRDGAREPCETRDVSLEGLFVLVDAGELEVGAGSQLNLDFIVHGSARRRTHRVPARVARVDGDGIGLRFETGELDVLARLATLVHGENVQRTTAADSLLLRMVI